MRHGRAALLFLLGFSVSLLVAGAAWGQTELFGIRLDGSMELGGRGYIDRPSDRESAKFEEYRDIPSGIFLKELHLGLSTKDDRYLFEFKAKEAGENDQNFLLRSSKLGRYEFEFEWDQTPHIFSTTGRMLGTEERRGVFTLPSPRPAAAAYNAGRELKEIGVRWDTARLSLTLTPSPDWDLKAEHTRIHKDGDRPMGMSFGSPGNNFREILEPIDQTVHDLKLSANLSRESYQLQFTYNFSLFQNALDAVVSDNPSVAADTVAAGSSRGRIALPPDNMAHTWTLAGGVNLPLRTRVNSSLSYSWRLQHQDFLPHTINTAISNNDLLSLPNDLNGDVRTLLFNLSATSRPLRPLTLTAKYRLYNYNDQTDEIVFPAHVVSDRTLENEDRRAPRFPFTKHNAGVDARWRILTPLALTLGMGWERWDRTDKHREAPITDEYLPKAALDLTPWDWLLLRLTYAPSWRENNDYNPHAHLSHVVLDEDGIEAAQSQHVRLRKFDEANRNRQRVDLLLQLTPIETLTTSLTYSLREDDYTNSFFGLQEDRNWAAGFDLNWTPAEGISLFASYVREESRAQQRSRYREPTQLENTTYDWIARTHDTIDTFGAGVNATLIPRTLDLGVNWNFSYALMRMKAFNPVTPAGGTAAQRASATATNFPAIEDSLNRVETFLRYHFWKKWTAKLKYAFESFEKTDFRTDQLVPSTGADIFLGNNLKDYTSHIVSFTLGYRF